MIYEYALRCLETDYPQLIQLGKVLGVITEIEGVISGVGFSAWDYIGYIPDETTGTLQLVGDSEIMVGQTPKGVNGVPYVHVNLRTETNIRERAEALAIENPAIAGALSQIPKFFITDAEGNATLPQNPYRVFA